MLYDYDDLRYNSFLVSCGMTRYLANSSSFCRHRKYVFRKHYNLIRLGTRDRNTIKDIFNCQNNWMIKDHYTISSFDRLPTISRFVAPFLLLVTTVSIWDGFWPSISSSFSWLVLESEKIQIYYWIIFKVYCNFVYYI